MIMERKDIPVPSDTSHQSVRVLFDTMAQHGLRYVVCSPGSRNTPLLLAADCRKDLWKYIVVDERTAGYVALGMAKTGSRPVALVCTSGTAMLNYAPALAEAYYEGLPLIVVSADRPMEWIDQDDSQTIRQYNVYHNFIKASYDIPSGRTDSDFYWWENRIVNEGMAIALKNKRGPVHFNIHLDNPLESTVPFTKNFPRKVDVYNPVPFLSKKELLVLIERLKGKKILIVAGSYSPAFKMHTALKKFYDMPNVAIMAETVSNLHTDPMNHMIDSVLCHLSEEDKERLRPDVVISYGGALISRMLKEYLRNYPPLEHWDIDSSSVTSDCFKSLTIKIDTYPSAFFSHLGIVMSALVAKGDLKECPEYAQAWLSAREKAATMNAAYIESVEWSELKAFDIISKNIPSNAYLFLSNGTTVRYHQIINRGIPLAVYCNRGVSGIEGCTSTAIGISIVYRKGITLLITGDMSLSYDIGAFASRLASPAMRIIVINNSGGGIFRFIRSTSKLEQREKYFCADPHMPVREIAEAYGWRYFQAEDEDSLTTALPEFLSYNHKKGSPYHIPSPAILEVFAPPQTSAEILRRFFKT